MEAMVYFDFTVDIWRVIVRQLNNNDDTTMQLLWVSRNSRKGVLKCFEWWKATHPLLYAKFYEIKTQTIRVNDFPLFCLYFTTQATINNTEGRLAELKRYLPVIEGKKFGPTELKRRKERRENDLKRIVKLEEKLLRPNPFTCPVTLSKTAQKNILSKAKKERRYHSFLKMVDWIENKSKAFFDNMKSEKKNEEEQKPIEKKQKKRSRKEDSDSDYVE